MLIRSDLNSIYSCIDHKNRRDIDDRFSKIRTYNICDPEFIRETLHLIVTRFFELHLGDYPNLDLIIYLDGENIMKSSDKEFFEFSGSNVFSWSTKNVSESQLKNLYMMIVENTIKGILSPQQKLPDEYHNLILAECIKGNRKESILKYLQQVEVKNV